MYQHHKGTISCLFKTYYGTHLVTHNYNTRHKLNYRIEVAKTNVRYFSVKIANVRYFSVKIAGPKLWNSVSPCMGDLHSYATFKNAYKASLLNMYH